MQWFLLLIPLFGTSGPSGPSSSLPLEQDANILHFLSCMGFPAGMDLRWFISQVRHEEFLGVTCKTFYVSIPITTAAPAIKKFEDVYRWLISKDSMTVINNIPCCGGEVCVQLFGTFLSEDKHCQASVVTALKNIINMARKYHFYFSSETPSFMICCMIPSSLFVQYCYSWYSMDLLFVDIACITSLT